MSSIFVSPAINVFSFFIVFTFFVWENIVIVIFSILYWGGVCCENIVNIFNKCEKYYLLKKNVIILIKNRLHLLYLYGTTQKSDKNREK